MHVSGHNRVLLKTARVSLFWKNVPVMIIMSKQKTVFRASGCGQHHSATSAQHILTAISPYRPTCRYCRGSWCTVHGWPSRTRLSISPNMSNSCWTQAPRHLSTRLNSWWTSTRTAREERLTGERTLNEHHQSVMQFCWYSKSHTIISLAKKNNI